MRNEPIHEERYNGHAIKIYVDLDPENPRDWDNVGTMACWHRKYKLGDVKPKERYHDHIASIFERKIPKCIRLDQDKEAIPKIEKLFDGHYYSLRLYLYDHSGITMSTSPFPCPWDSGQVGVIYISKVKARAEWNNMTAKQREEKAFACMEQEVKTYDAYLRGEVYGYVVEDQEGEHVDSCWGFIGDMDACVAQAREALDFNTKCAHTGMEASLS